MDHWCSFDSSTGQMWQRQISNTHDGLSCIESGEHMSTASCQPCHCTGTHDWYSQKEILRSLFCIDFTILMLKLKFSHNSWSLTTLAHAMMARIQRMSSYPHSRSTHVGWWRMRSLAYFATPRVSQTTCRSHLPFVLWCMAKPYINSSTRSSRTEKIPYTDEEKKTVRRQELDKTLAGKGSFVAYFHKEKTWKSFLMFQLSLAALRQWQVVVTHRRGVPPLCSDPLLRLQLKRPRDNTRIPLLHLQFQRNTHWNSQKSLLPT